MKTLLFCFLFTLPIAFSSCGQQDKTNKEKKTDSIQQVIPIKPIGRVSDFEKILSSEQVSDLENIIAEHEKATTNQVAIVTCWLDSTLIRTTDDFDSFSLSLFNHWKIGTKEKMNGIAIIVSKELRRVRIEVGYGLETKLTNSEAKTIIDSIMLPEFREARYFTGISNGLLAIIEEIK